MKGPHSENGTGRVEVYHNGTWGTICDDGWNMKDARVACRQLGYEDAVKALHGHQVPSRSGSGKMWLDEVDCTGKEQNIADCSHIGWDTTNCGSHENAGVECSSTGKVLSIISYTLYISMFVAFSNFFKSHSPQYGGVDQMHAKD